MATSVFEVYSTAVKLIDEQNEDIPDVTTDNQEYTFRSYNAPDRLNAKTLGIMNTLIQELFPYTSDTPYTSGRLEVVNTARRVAFRNTEPGEDVDLDDYLAQAVLPYGLAAELIRPEDTAQYDRLFARYLMLKEEAKNTKKSTIEPITDVYGGMSGYYDKFSRWA